MLAPWRQRAGKHMFNTGAAYSRSNEHFDGGEVCELGETGTLRIPEKGEKKYKTRWGKGFWAGKSEFKNDHFVITADCGKMYSVSSSQPHDSAAMEELARRDNDLPDAGGTE